MGTPKQNVSASKCFIHFSVSLIIKSVELTSLEAIFHLLFPIFYVLCDSDVNPWLIRLWHQLFYWLSRKLCTLYTHLES